MPDTRPIALLAAMAEEHEELARHLEGLERKKIAGRTILAGNFAGQPVVLAESGVGKVASATSATLLLHAFGCRAIAVAGVAGGIDPNVAIGDVVVADRLIQHDYGHRTMDGLLHYRPGVPPLGPRREEIEFVVPLALIARLRDRLNGMRLPEIPADLRGEGRGGIAPKLLFGPIVSGDQFINSEQTRAEIHKAHGALAVEMEGAAVAQVAEAFGVPCVVVRSVSDRAGSDSHLDFPRFLKVTAPIAAEIVGRIVTLL